MKTFRGKRDMDGLIVTVDDRRLAAHHEVKQFTKWGFQWTYAGTSPRRLALAILYDHLGDKARTICLSEPFMKSVAADTGNDRSMTGAEVERAIG
jgi:hypothetical protein